MSVETFHDLLAEFTGKPTTRFIILNKVTYLSARTATPSNTVSPTIIIHIDSLILEYHSKKGTSMEETIALTAKLSRLIQGD